jgi:hypothetical protein
MITYLPHPSFELSAWALDDKMLYRQQLDCWSIWAALSYSRATMHTAPVRMWMGYSVALIAYEFACATEWQNRGYPLITPTIGKIDHAYDLPKWIGNEQLHSSHRSNLLRLNYRHYSQFNWTDEPGSLYYWPR